MIFFFEVCFPLKKKKKESTTTVASLIIFLFSKSCLYLVWNIMFYLSATSCWIFYFLDFVFGEVSHLLMQRLHGITINSYCA